MRLGIVGVEKSKFTEATEELAREEIRHLIDEYHPSVICSGQCHLGGVDIFAVEEARNADIDVKEFPPKQRNWAEGYRPRNIQIAHFSDLVVCITVKKLPKTYKGMRFPKCYHCQTDTHVKSGGCWTVKYAQRLGKQAYVIVIKE